MEKQRKAGPEEGVVSSPETAHHYVHLLLRRVEAGPGDMGWDSQGIETPTEE